MFRSRRHTSPLSNKGSYGDRYMSTSLEERIKKLEDIEEICRLRMQYHNFINDKMFDRFTELFTEDAFVDFGYISKARGTEEIRELGTSIYPLPLRAAV
jgi:hypothetical protein